MSVGEFIGWLDGLVWGTVMMVLIIVVGILGYRNDGSHHRCRYSPVR